MYGLTHRGQYSAGSSPGDPTYDSLPDDRKALVDRARALWAEQDQAQPGNIVQSIADQTPAGAIARDPELLMKDKGWLAGNQDLYLRNEASSITAFDMRTADEVRRGVAPVGWTPGRGIAHNVASPTSRRSRPSPGSSTSATARCSTRQTRSRSARSARSRRSASAACRSSPVLTTSARSSAAWRPADPRWASRPSRRH